MAGRFNDQHDGDGGSERLRMVERTMRELANRQQPDFPLLARLERLRQLLTRTLNS